MREIALLCMFRGLEQSLKLAPTLKKKPIDSFQIGFGKNGIMRFTLDNDSILLFAQLLITKFSQNIFFGNKQLDNKVQIA